ncbi:MAG TPA: hypothetical protein VFQ39_18125 [Longimicrobium sp.]|nr:hypothetical protein [Longimicrobium sp.]
MRKVKLELDSLAVESFATSGRKEERGTVLGHASFRCDSEIVCYSDLVDCPIVDTGSCSGPVGTCVTCGGAGCSGYGGGQTSRCV